MASVVKLGMGKQPPRAIDFTHDNKRKRIRLGVVSREDANQVCRLVEKLVACKSLNTAPDSDVIHWLAGLSDEIHRRIADKGLTEPRNPPPASPTLSAFLGKYIEQRKSDLAASSVKRLEYTKKSLEAFFGAETRLDAITADGAADRRAKLLETLSEATTRLDVRNAKSMFTGAVERELLKRNPFKALKSAAIAAERGRYVTPEEAAAILDACADLRWRVLFGLARLAGLRTPSETHRLTWADVDWARRRLTVFAPKTGKYRTVPIVPALHRWLQDAFEEAPPGSEQIVTVSRNNLHRGLEAIIKRASLSPWDDLWQTLRRSCETQWALEFPQHVVSEWIGHSVAVSLRHYVQTPDHLLDLAAAGKPLRAAESAAANRGTEGNSEEKSAAAGDADNSAQNEKTPVCAADSGETGVFSEVVRGGVEPPTHGFSVHCSTN